MNLKYLVIPFAGLFVVQAFAADVSLDTDKKKISYAIGMQIGNDFKQRGLDIDVTAMSAAVRDILKGKKTDLDQSEMKQALSLLRDQQMKKQTTLANENKVAGEAFLAQNKSKPGVVVLPSGVQYKVIKKGAGKSPTPENSVLAHYEGRLIDGTVFDSSIKRGQPATFPVTRVIKGWVEILQKMKTGSKWEVYIPSDLAYGSRGTGSGIGPNATLIFEIELIEIK